MPATQTSERVPGWVSVVLSRSLQAAVTLGLLSFCSFALFEWIPGDFLTETAASPAVSPETLAGLRDRYGLDTPLGIRYASWLEGLTRGQLGPSLSYQRDAMGLLLPRLGATVLLNLTALLVALVVALPLAIFAAQNPESRFAGWVGRGMQASLALPELVLVLALFAVAQAYGVPMPGGAAASADESWLGGLYSLLTGLAPPAIALAAGTAPSYFGHMRAAWSEALAESYVIAARQAGLPPKVVRWRYLFPAAANPMVSLLGGSLGGILSASLLVETVTGWPGLGPLLLEAVFSRDVYVVVGAVMFAASAQMAGNLAADLVILRMDPRIRS
jgi:peptide/nickel transport system permease protein